MVIYLGGDTLIPVIAKNSSTPSTTESNSFITNITRAPTATNAANVTLSCKPEYMRLDHIDPKRHYILDANLQPVEIVKITQYLAPKIEITHNHWPKPITLGYNTPIWYSFQYRVAPNVESTVPRSTQRKRGQTLSICNDLDKTYYITDTIDAINLVDKINESKHVFLFNNFTDDFNLYTVPIDPSEPNTILKFDEGYVPLSFNVGYIFGMFSCIGSISSDSAIFTLNSNCHLDTVYELINTTFSFVKHRISKIANMIIITHHGLVNLFKQFRPQPNGNKIFPKQFKCSYNRDYVKGVLNGIETTTQPLIFKSVENSHSIPQDCSLDRLLFETKSQSSGNQMEEPIELVIIWCCEILGMRYEFINSSSSGSSSDCNNSVVSIKIDNNISAPIQIVKAVKTETADTLYCIHISTKSSANSIVISGGLVISL